MRKNILIIVVLIFAAFFIINNLRGTVVETTVTKPFRYASLLTKEPEQKIQIPLRGVKAKQITDTFEAPRGNDRLHQGQDIFSPRGTPVYSATAGYVWHIGENELGGNTVSVIGAGGRYYYYAHLDAYAPDLKTGDEVTPDTILGYVGDTGNAKGTPPHLHFGVYTTDGAINPLSLFE